MDLEAIESHEDAPEVTAILPPDAPKWRGYPQVRYRPFVQRDVDCCIENSTSRTFPIGHLSQFEGVASAT